MGYKIQIASDNAALCRMAAQEFQRAAESAIGNHGDFAVALAGGNTPRTVYALLAAEYANKIDWTRAHIFFGDERCVPPDHPDSNYRMANETLLSMVPIPAENIHRVRAELAPDAAAQDYEKQLREFFHLPNGECPRFDLVLLGLGDDGHTASLFPGTAALQESSCMVVANWVEKLHNFRITLTFPVLNHAAEILFLVSGLAKAPILKDVLNSSAKKYPAQLIQPEDGCLLWLADQDAARQLART